MASRWPVDAPVLAGFVWNCPPSARYLAIFDLSIYKEHEDGQRSPTPCGTSEHIGGRCWHSPEMARVLLHSSQSTPTFFSNGRSPSDHFKEVSGNSSTMPRTCDAILPAEDQPPAIRTGERRDGHTRHLTRGPSDSMDRTSPLSSAGSTAQLSYSA